MVGGISLTYLTQGKEGRHEYWSRIVDPKRIRAKWYLVIFLFVPALMAVAALLDFATGGSGTLAQIEERVAPFLAAPLTIVPFALGVFVQGPLPEELGWRGYVLDRLQSRWTALVSSLILGTIWALWHLPLFFIKDMIHFTHGVWSAWFWQFMVGVVPMAVILTWIFNNTRRSTLAAILFHFMANLTYGLANVTAGTNFYSTLLWIIAAIAVVALWGPGTLVRREHSPLG
jgi:CAAX protease family protein